MCVMSLRCASLSLLVLLGVITASCSPVSFVNEDLARTHSSITDPLKLKEPVIGSNPLFSFVIKSINNSCQEEVMLMNATLDVYTRIFSSILTTNSHSHHERSLLEKLPPTDKHHVHNALEKLWHKMKKLKSDLSHLQQNKEELLNKLSTIKVDDPLVQRKALAEFLEVFQAASVVSSWGRTH